MALRYFRGRVDLDKLSLADLAAAAGALAALERLAASGTIFFETGASRASAPRPDMQGVRVTARSQQQADIVEILRKEGPMSYPALKAATGMKEGSLSPNLTALVREGVLRKEATREPGQVGRARRMNTVYSLPPPQGARAQGQ
jgi:hypothetical protein